ncbi:hypothetical protein JTB14_018892 [Gonioctena quinquepunctata]|nr:hypothetical protein JTB14_018892 [Gonioctena quinquepunctata]
MDIDLLIAEVQKRRVLWDTTDEEYKDRNTKNTAWTEVAEAVCSEDFKPKQEAEQKVFGAARKRVPHYIHEEQLRFLKKNREMRPTQSTVDTIEDDNDGFTDDHDHVNLILNENENGETAEETSSERTATSESQTPSTINSKRKKTNIEDKVSQFIDTTLKKQKENDRKVPDEDGAFFTSLIPSVRLLTNDEKIQFLIEVLQLLQRFKNNKTADTGTTVQYSTGILRIFNTDMHVVIQTTLMIIWPP